MSNDVEQIELSITDAKEKVAMGDALERLLKNADFDKVVMKGYFQEEAIRLVQAKSYESTSRPEVQAGILRCIDGIGSLYQYFGKIDKQADMAIAAIHDAEETLSEMAEQGEL